MTTYFSTTKLGKTLAHHRKEKNLTQSEVAESLGVSHQAVSSWENGLTCPDIAKLADLSRLFEVSIDVLLDNENLGRIVTKVENEEVLQEKELIAVAPLTKPSMLDDLVDKADPKSFNIKTLVALAPFLGEEKIETWLQEFEGETDLKSIVPLAPFVSSSTILRLFHKFNSDALSLKDLASLAPFLDQNDLHTIILDHTTSADFSDIIPLAPFASKETLAQLIDMAIENKTLKSKQLVGLAPFLGEKTLSKVVQSISKQEDFDAKELVALAPFMDRDCLKRIVEAEMKKGKLDSLRSLMPFI